MDCRLQERLVNNGSDASFLKPEQLKLITVDPDFVLFNQAATTEIGKSQANLNVHGSKIGFTYL